MLISIIASNVMQNCRWIIIAVIFGGMQMLQNFYRIATENAFGFLINQKI
jgi:hypothetical protein